MIKSDNVFYKFNYDNAPKNDGRYKRVTLEENFRKVANIPIIINCGIYDILIYDKHVNIFNNVLPFNELNELPVDEDPLSLLKYQKFI
jgi:hypothetical protein